MKRMGLTISLFVVVILLVAGLGYVSYTKGLFGLHGNVVKDSGSNISDYSAVFLTNGQVYFGKITGNTTDEVELTDIYYLQVNQTVQPSTGTNAAEASPAPDISLIKLGNELHGPNDEMHINRAQVLFTESLKSDSKVVKAISTDKASGK